ncbi:dihydrofolate reductase [Paenibacillus hamazuiensis]|uniref:dihydrofolate reductase n=1 Tax=Paenibacillus hamazuiensis TaxID=2936508 RepID=UPI00200CCB6D|nr:dihydrofolate reductase [Paenibacillus hamazuiensis]
MLISLIAAVSTNNVIGKDEAIPWKIPGEQKRFKELTTGRTIVMGRKTYESIGKPLPDRKTVIVSRSCKIAAERCVTVTSLDEAYELLRDENEIFIAGGGEIYKEALPHADKIYLTVIDQEVEGNIFFPAWDKDDFEMVDEERITSSTIPYTYYTYIRKSK